jgi:hypothetical protein
MKTETDLRNGEIKIPAEEYSQGDETNLNFMIAENLKESL